MDNDPKKARPAGAFIPQELLTDAELGPTEKLLFALIPECSQSNSDGSFFANGWRLAGFVGVSPSTISRSLERLKLKGWIDYRKKEGNGGGYKIRFKKASIAAAMIAVVSFSQIGASLHNVANVKNPLGCDMGELRPGLPRNMDYSTKRRRRPKSAPKRPLPVAPPTPPEPDRRILFQSL